MHTIHSVQSYPRTSAVSEHASASKKRLAKLLNHLCTAWTERLLARVHASTANNFREVVATIIQSYCSLSISLACTVQYNSPHPIPFSSTSISVQCPCLQSNHPRSRTATLKLRANRNVARWRELTGTTSSYSCGCVHHQSMSSTQACTHACMQLTRVANLAVRFHTVLLQASEAGNGVYFSRHGVFSCAGAAQ
jgi:hypothetical protein